MRVGCHAWFSNFYMNTKNNPIDGVQDLGWLNRAPIKIRINKCSHVSAWYAGRVGTEIEVEKVEVMRHPYQGIPEDVYWVRTGDRWNTINYVLKSDATEL